ncbi:MAG: prepilin-type N-terminal cleavage/methylation domain-containing protein [Candidatus Omnitrophica bacterium]|nr:prepilin-type N-terminal cleavage/methylation domain-containing protein [Candidatus Omnitrophota bacterium]
MKENRFHITFFGRRRGFTLTEILIVVIIIAILATLALPMLVKTIEKAKVGEAISNLNLIRTGEKIYCLEWATFSSDIEELNIESPNDATSRYFYYTIEDADDSDFTARATRGGDGAQSAPSPYDTHYYEIDKDGTVTGSSGSLL